ncbi:PREDICTED: uncharacterized protein LOC106810476 [Priapulus caudatus]|uniref:Uncharacterized protein LOC106810476 n=1 Tax=Priapulus caudatus TaxID=37621 RepID=A0ABM1EAW9_PRICU|nr:PREDICTED: uncharacterized protein LOC106810476 [Priapulus caudatus]
MALNDYEIDEFEAQFQDELEAMIDVENSDLQSGDGHSSRISQNHASHSRKSLPFNSPKSDRTNSVTEAGNTGSLKKRNGISNEEEFVCIQPPQKRPRTSSSPPLPSAPQLDATFPLPSLDIVWDDDDDDVAVTKNPIAERIRRERQRRSTAVEVEAVAAAMVFSPSQDIQRIQSERARRSVHPLLTSSFSNRCDAGVERRRVLTRAPPGECVTVTGTEGRRVYMRLETADPADERKKEEEEKKKKEEAKKKPFKPAGVVELSDDLDTHGRPTHKVTQPPASQSANNE